MNGAKILLTLVWTLLALMVLTLIGVTLALAVYDDKLEAMIADKVEQSTGRQFEIADGFSFRFNPWPTLGAKKLRLANAEWGRTPWMLEIERAEASLSLLALLRGQLKVGSVTIEQPVMRVEHRMSASNETAQPDQQVLDNNWLFGRKRERKTYDRLAKHLFISRAQIMDATLDVFHGERRNTFFFNQILGKMNWRDKSVELDSIGHIHDEIFVLNAHASDFGSMLRREPVSVVATGTWGETRLGAIGQIGDLMRWQGLDIELQADAPGLQALQPWMPNISLIKTPPITANARLAQPGRWRSAAFRDVQLSAQGWGVQLDASGEVGQIRGWQDIDIKGEWQAEIQPLLVQIGFSPAAYAMSQGRFTVSGSRQTQVGLALDGTLEGEGVSGEISGNIPDLLADTHPAGLPIKLQTDSAQRIGDLLGKKWLESDSLRATGILGKQQQKWGIHEIKAFRGAHTVPGLSGAMQALGKARKGKFALDITALAGDIREINQLNRARNLRLPEVDSLAIKGDIQVNGQKSHAEHWVIALTDQRNTLSVRGPIPDLRAFAVSNAELEADFPNIPDLNALFGLKLPDLGHFKGQGKLSGSPREGFALSSITATAAGEGHQIRGAGVVENLGKESVQHLRANLSLTTENARFSSFQHLLDIPMPAALTLSGSAVLKAQGASNWQLDEIALQGRDDANLQATLAGSVTGIPKTTQYALKLNAENANQALLAAFVNHPVNLKGRTPFQLPMFDSLNLYAELSNAHPAPLAVPNLRLDLLQGNMKLSAAGNIQQLAPFEKLLLDAELTADNLKAIPYFSSLERLQPGIATQARFRLEAAANDVIVNLNQFQAGNTEASGSLRWQGSGSKAGKAPKLDLKLVSQRLDLKELFKREKKKRLFSDEPLGFGWVRSMDSDISVRAAEVEHHAYRLHNMQFSGQARNKQLQIRDFTAGFGEGQINGWLSLDANGDKYQVVTSMLGQGLKPTDLNFPESDFMQKGNFDIDLGIAGQGKSLSQVMDTAYGKVKFTLNDTVFKNKPLDLFGSDLVFGLINTINPLRKKDDALHNIECGVIHFPIVDGVAQASQGIAIKSDRLTILGGGQIDLGKEDLNLLIRPKPRTGLGLSPSSVAQLIQLGGSIGQPKIEIAPTGLLEAGANIGVAVLTGGWSLLAKGLLDRTQANADVCAQTEVNPGVIDAETSQSGAVGSLDQGTAQ